MFVLTYNGQTLLYGAYKEYGDKGIKVGKYYATDLTSLIKVKFIVSALSTLVKATEATLLTARIRSTAIRVSRSANITLPIGCKITA